jgi:tetratricopeptide (TPR) repeat protein
VNGIKVWRLVFRQLLARFAYIWGSLHRQFGNKSSFTREHELALHFFNLACRWDPNLYPAQLDRGILLWREMGRIDEAIADFDNLLEKAPNYPLALLNRAMASQAAGRYAAALADLELFLTLDQDDEEYRSIATRTAVLLRQLLSENNT